MSQVTAFSKTPPDDMSHVGRAVDFVPGDGGILSHFVVCGIAPEDIAENVTESSNQIVPMPKVLFHWAPPDPKTGEAPSLPDQFLDFCFPVDRHAMLKWVPTDSPLVKDAIYDPQHETVDPFVFLISGNEHPTIGVAISRLELARVSPPLIVKKQQRNQQAAPVKPEATPEKPDGEKTEEKKEEGNPEEKKDDENGAKPEDEKKESEQKVDEAKPEGEKKEEDVKKPEEKKGDEEKKEEAKPEEEKKEEVKPEEVKKNEEKKEEVKPEEKKTPVPAPTEKKDEKAVQPKPEEKKQCYVAVTRRCYVVLSTQCVLPLLAEMLTAILGVDFSAFSDNRRKIVDIVLSPDCTQRNLDDVINSLVPEPIPPLALAMMKFCNEALKVPKPGEMLQYKMPSLPSQPQTPRMFRCPSAPSVRDSAMSILMDWSLVTLFEYLDLPNVISVLTAIWCERPVLFVCPDISVLTSIAFSILPASRPLSWQGIFIPLLPCRMSDCIDAPVPYVIGLPSLPNNDPPEAHRVEDVLVVDVLKNIVYNWGEKIPSLPDSRVLMDKLRPLHKEVFAPAKVRNSASFFPRAPRGSTKRIAIAQQLAARLAEYTTWILTQVQQHYRNMCAKAGAPVSMSALEKSFINSAKRANRPFIADFVKSQQFATYFIWNISLEPPPGENDN